MIDPRDRHDFDRLREPTLEDYALPPKFLRGDPKREQPFQPIPDPNRYQGLGPEPLRVTVVELVGLAGFVGVIGFILGYYCAFVR